MDTIAQHFINFVDTPWAPFLLFVHAFLESSFLPGAHDIFLVAVDVIRPQMCFYFAIFSTLGSVCGGCFGYAIGKFGGRPLFEKIAKKSVADTVEKSYKRFGMWAVLIAGFTPVPYKLFAIASGIFEIRFIPFVLISFFARGARFFLVSWLMFFMGETIKNYVVGYLNIFSIVLVAVVIICVVVTKILMRRIKHD